MRGAVTWSGPAAVEGEAPRRDMLPCQSCGKATAKSIAFPTIECRCGDAPHCYSEPLCPECYRMIEAVAILASLCSEHAGLH